jgi:hypothetical protein
MTRRKQSDDQDLINSRCASAWVIAVASVPNLAVFRGSAATCRAIVIAIDDTALAVPARGRGPPRAPEMRSAASGILQIGVPGEASYLQV